MNEDLKDKWAAALRSGDYNQTTGCLRENDSYCCLGVLCDVIDPTKWDKTKAPFAYAAEDDSSRIYVPTSLRHSLKLSVMDQALLMGLNDNHNLTFAHIARVVEELL